MFLHTEKHCCNNTSGLSIYWMYYPVCLSLDTDDVWNNAHSLPERSEDT